MKQRYALAMGMVTVLVLSLVSGSARAGKQGTCNSEGGDPLCPFGEPGCDEEENGSAGGPGVACEYDGGSYGSDVLHCIFQHYQSQGFNGEDVNFEFQGSSAPVIQVFQQGNVEPDSLCYRENNELTAHTWVEIESPGLVGKIRKPTQLPSGFYDPSGPPKIQIKLKNLVDGPTRVIEVPTTGVPSVAALQQLIWDGLDNVLEAQVQQTKEFYIILGLPDVDEDGNDVIRDVHHVSFYSSDSGVSLSEIEIGNNGAWHTTNCTPVPNPR